jgi:chromosome segregation ATPase
VGSKVLKQKLHDIEAVLKFRDNQIEELQALLKSKDGQIAQLQRLGGTREGQPENPQDSVIVSLKKQETGVIQDAQGQREIYAKDEELKTLLSAISNKQLEMERLQQTIARQEEDFRIKLDAKNVEIDEVKTTLNTLQKSFSPFTARVSGST